MTPAVPGTGRQQGVAEFPDLWAQRWHAMLHNHTNQIWPDNMWWCCMMQHDATLSKLVDCCNYLFYEGLKMQWYSICFFATLAGIKPKAPPHPPFPPLLCPPTNAHARTHTHPEKLLSWLYNLLTKNTLTNDYNKNDTRNGTGKEGNINRKTSVLI